MDRATAVRLATEQDRAIIAPMFARAFAQDPAYAFIFPNAETRQRQLSRLFSLVTASDLRSGHGFVIDEGAAVTLWRAPGQAKVGWVEMLQNGPALLQTLGGSLVRGLRASAAVEHRFPSEPFHYLHIVACDPALQGRGLGGAAIRAGLAAVPPGMPCYLETATEAKIGLYQHFGFEVTEAWCLPGGPPMWSMRRPAA